MTRLEKILKKLNFTHNYNYKNVSFYTALINDKLYSISHHDDESHIILTINNMKGSSESFLMDVTTSLNELETFPVFIQILRKKKIDLLLNN